MISSLSFWGGKKGYPLFFTSLKTIENDDAEIYW